MMTNLKTALFFTFCLLWIGRPGNAQTVSPDKNAVTHYQARTATGDPDVLINNHQNAVTTIQYLDGLGRPIQTVGYGATPTGKDLIQQTIQYDNYGRPVQTFLPAPALDISGGHRPNALSLGQGFYGDTHPFGQVKQFDNSPLNRVKQNYGAGQAWQTNSKYKETFYEAAGSDIRRYTVDGSGNVNLPGTFPNSSLFKLRMVDEQGNTFIEIKDTRGRLVERQEQDGSGFMATHYVYDGLDRPLAVIQPQGYALNSGFSYNSSGYANHVFAYEYGNNGLAIRKHVPGGGWTSYVYDKGDRIVLEQTARQAETNQWSFTKYDVFGRAIMLGELVNANSRATLQTSFDAVTNPYETWNGSGYSSQSFPISHNATDVRQTNYYDQYSWVAGDWAFNAPLAYNAASHWPNATGQPTGGWARDPENASVVYHSVIYYDNKNRVLQTFQTHLKGGANRASKPLTTSFEYNFAGEVTKEKVVYKIDGKGDTETVTTNEYDHAGRIMKVFHRIGGAADQELCRYGYDEIGRLKEKKLLPNGTYLYGGTPDYINRPPSPTANTGDLAKKAVTLLPGTEITNVYAATIDPNAPSGTSITGLQTIGYAHHIRGGLRGMNLDNSGNPVTNASQGDLFSLKLDYETAGQWDGNIGRQTWKNDTEGQRSYSYAYDPAKRLKSATYTGVGNEDYSLPNISYDNNGNITQLQRKGATANGSYGLIDNLNYNYGSSGNRLVGVSDGVGGNTDVGDFRDNGSNVDYTYWADGSLKSDANKGINLIEYDTFLKKVKQVNWSDGRWLKFIYDGGGTLIKRQNSLGDSWEYVGKMVFKDGQFYQLSTPEGRAVHDGSNWNYEFEYRDVWGNLRVAFKAENGQLVKVQGSDYDALGFEFNKATQEKTNKSKYQKQERIEDFNLGIDLFKFRPSDYQIGRFWQIDPLATEYVYNSPYALQENKFGMGIELEGAELLTFNQLQLMYYDVKDRLTNTGIGRSMQGATRYAQNENRHSTDNAYTRNVPGYVRSQHYQQEKYNATAEMVKGGVEVMDNITTATGLALGGIEGAAGKALLGNGAKNAAGRISGKQMTNIWPAASDGRAVINGIEYTVHALERMQPVGTIMQGKASFSRGIPPSVVENAIKFGEVTPGNTKSEVIRTFENVRVITNPEGTRVITVY